MPTQDNRARICVRVVIHVAKEKKFCNKALSNRLISDSEVERLDFAHGPFDLSLRAVEQSRT
jgi:hypothetical protein